MPHIYIEHTAGVAANVNWECLVQELHRATAEVAGLRLDLMKTRILRIEQYFVGDCSKIEEFVSLKLYTVSGRAGDDSRRTAIAQTILKVVVAALGADLEESALDVSVQITESPGAGYARLRSATLRQ